MQIRNNLFLLVVLLTIGFPALLFAQKEPAQIILPNRTNSAEQQQKPYVILISIDGLRYDLADKFDAKFLKQKRAEGIEAVSMQPSFPSMTFPNHYTLATGLFPAHNGIVANSFYSGEEGSRQLYSMRIKKTVQDPQFYGGTPLWVLAEKQGMLSAVFYWVGSEAPIDSTFATYYYEYSQSIPIDRRVEIVKNWLTLPKEKRPHLILFYMPEVDKAEHLYGVASDKVRDAVQIVDSAVRKLNEMTDKLGLPVSYVLVSDHGMMDVDTSNPVEILKLVDTSRFDIGYGAALINLYAKDKKDIKTTFKTLRKEADGYSVYLKHNTPKRWKYNAKNDCYNHIGDIILVAKPGRSFALSKKWISVGNHGYDNKLPAMQATFYAWGPGFKKNKKIPSFENVDVYPMIAKLLGLNLPDKIDGKLKPLSNILK